MHTDVAKTATVLRPKRFLFFILPFILCILFFSCTTGKSLGCLPEGYSSPPETPPHIRSVPLYPEEFIWEPLVSGIQYTSFSNKTSSIGWHLVSIDLSQKELQLTAYPSEAEIDPDGTIQGITVKKYAKKIKAIVAVNASPFNYTGLSIFPGRRLVGLHVYQGQRLSPPIKKYAALAFFEDFEGNYKASIFSDQTLVPSQALHAFGGFYAILKQGEIIDFPALSFDSRLAAGVSKDGKTLYLLFTPGNFFGTAGLSFEECAVILSKAGAWEALQFDGGSSATMTIEGKNIKKTGFRRVANIFAFTLSNDTNFN